MTKEYHTVHVYCSRADGDHTLIFTQEDWCAPPCKSINSFPPFLQLGIIITPEDWYASSCCESRAYATCSACGKQVPMGTRESGEFGDEMEEFFMDESRTGVYKNIAYQRLQEFDVLATSWTVFIDALEKEFGLDVSFESDDI